MTAHPEYSHDRVVLQNLHTNQDRLVRDVITLPLRIAACATRLGVRVTRHAVVATLDATWRLIEAVAPVEPRSAATDDRAQADGVRLDIMVVPPRNLGATPSTSAQAPKAPPPAAAEPPPPPAAEAAAPPRSADISPGHVSEELQFVEAFAEPGAEEGAGAAVHVMEPWRGYRQMTANEVIERLADASREELAAVLLYEGGHRRRQTVIAEARRSLREATAATGREGRGV